MRYIIIALIGCIGISSPVNAQTQYTHHSYKLTQVPLASTTGVRWKLTIDEKEFFKLHTAKRHIASLPKGSKLHFYVKTTGIVGNEIIPISIPSLRKFSEFCKENSIDLIISYGTAAY
jgi:hypothetical protein